MSFIRWRVEQDLEDAWHILSMLHADQCKFLKIRLPKFIQNHWRCKGPRSQTCHVSFSLSVGTLNCMDLQDVWQDMLNQCLMQINADLSSHYSTFPNLCTGVSRETTVSDPSRANASMVEMDWYPHEINPYVHNWEIWCHFLWGHLNLSGKQTKSINFKFSTTHPLNGN